MNAFHQNDTVQYGPKWLNAIVSVIVLTLTLHASPAFSKATKEQEEEAQVFVQEISDRAFEALKDVSLQGQERRARFRDILLDGVAIDYVAPFLLGRFYRSADKAQIEEYRRVFPDYIIGFYTDQLLKIGDEELQVVGTQPVGRSDVYVRSQLLRPDGGQPISADWRVKHTKSGSPKIIDLKIEGISVAETKKDEFASLIASKGFSAFLDELKSQAQNGLSSTAE